MSLRRVVLIGILLAAMAMGVIHIRLLTASAARQVLLLSKDKQQLQRRICQQELQLARLRAPWRIAAQLEAMDLNVMRPGQMLNNWKARGVSSRKSRVSTTAADTRRAERRLAE